MSSQWRQRTAHQLQLCMHVHGMGSAGCTLGCDHLPVPARQAPGSWPDAVLDLQVFTESKERLGGQDLDIFVVNRCSTSLDPTHCQQTLVALRSRLLCLSVSCLQAAG